MSNSFKYWTLGSSVFALVVIVLVMFSSGESEVAAEDAGVFGKDSTIAVLEESELAIHRDAEIVFREVEGEVVAEVIGSFGAAEYTTKMAEKDAEAINAFLNKEVTFIYDDQFHQPYEKVLKVNNHWLEVREGELVMKAGNLRGMAERELAWDLEREAEDAVLKSVPEKSEEYNNVFAEVEGVARDGRVIDYDHLVSNIKTVLERGEEKVYIPMEVVEGKVVNRTGKDLGSLEKVASGRSGFWGSAPGRKFNIRKGVDEKLQGILLEPGEEYSFNEHLGPVTYSAGWKPANAIFNGDELIPVPGGGLCQVSTTLYRAVLDSGMEVLDRYNHSLYVIYYEEGGNGLDATIYPGLRDFRFKNTSGNYVLFQAYHDGDYTYVNVYGTPNGVESEMIGPIYSGRVPEEYRDLVDPAWNEIAWIQKITDESGNVSLTPIMSKYRTAPRKLYEGLGL